MKILELPLKKEWYNMIESGEKREEYRNVTPYWMKRLVWDADYNEPVSKDDVEFLCSLVGRDDGTTGNFFDAGWEPKPYTHVRFRYGYTKRTMLYTISEITIGYGNPNWGAPTDKEVFIIKIGDNVQ